jgi:hypothetical protein
MAALLRFKRQSKSGVTCNIDRADMVHLDRNFKRHDFLAILSCRNLKRFRQAT